MKPINSDKYLVTEDYTYRIGQAILGKYLTLKPA